MITRPSVQMLEKVSLHRSRFARHLKARENGLKRVGYELDQEDTEEPIAALCCRRCGHIPVVRGRFTGWRRAWRQGHRRRSGYVTDAYPVTHPRI